MGKVSSHSIKDIPASGAKTRDYKIYRSILLKVLSSMKKGSLRLRLPDGSQLVLGDPNSDFPQEYHSAQIHIKDPIFFKRVVIFGDIGFAESYIDGQWETDSIQSVISWFLLNVEDSPNVSGSSKRVWHVNLTNIGSRLLHFYRKNSIRGSKQNIHDHYDLGNSFYGKFLDPTMTYSCAYFERLDMNLEQAQIRKYEALCQRAQLQKTDHVLEIGSGWGGFSIYAARNYGCRITTITISEEQYKYAKEKIRKEGLDGQIEIRLEDYRKVEGSFDKIVSIEMLEAVGDEFLDTYFSVCNKLLKPHGLLCLQVITSPDSRYKEFKQGVDFIQKHIFPGSLLPSIGRINDAVNRTSAMHLHELEDMGAYYVITLNRWRDAFEENLSEIRRLGYDESFIRKWRYYLDYCAAAFHMKNISVVQMVYTRPNNLRLQSVPV